MTEHRIMGATVAETSKEILSSGGISTHNLPIDATELQPLDSRSP